MALITPTTSYDGFDQVDIVVEAVFENMDLKKSTFAELGKVTRPDCMLASNSSTLDIDAVRARERPAGAGARPSFLQPGERDEAARDRARARDEQARSSRRSLKLAKKLGKVGVVVGNCFGFVANRMLAYYMREAYLLLEEGASVAADRSGADRFRPAGRPVRHAGHRRHRRRRAHPAVPEVDRQDARGRAAVGDSRPAVRDGPLRTEDRRRLVQVRRAGQPQPHPRSAHRAARARRKRRKRGITRRPIADEEIVARITTALANEGARVLEEGFALRAGRHRRRSTSTASGSRAIAADRCSTPTRSGCRPFWRA